LKLKEIAALVDGYLVGEAEFEIKGINNLEEAQAEDLVFLFHPRYLEQARVSRARSIVLGEVEAQSLVGKNLLIVDNPRLAYIKLAKYFSPFVFPPAGVHPSAFVHPQASLAEGVVVGPFSVIEEGATIAAGTCLFSQVYVGKGVKIGADCLIFPQVVIREQCQIGNRVILQAGVVIGGDGFGYERTKDGYLKLPHIGRVVIEDEVEIGANSTVDRATMGETRVGAGTKIDNLVMVAHNVKIGKNVVIVAQSGIAGSSTIGDNSVLAGQSGVVDHCKLESGVTVLSRGGVVNDIPAGKTVSGFPAQEHHQHLRQQALVKKLPQLWQRVRSLEKKIGGK